MIAIVAVVSLLCNAVATNPHAFLSNDAVYIENVPLVGKDDTDFGAGNLDVCESNIETVASQPIIKVCGNDVKMTIFFNDNCGEGSGNKTQPIEVGACNKALPSSTCQTFKTADDHSTHGAKSYKITKC